MVTIQRIEQGTNDSLTFAFSLYGNKKIYLEGLTYSIQYLVDYCPEDFSVLIYHDNSVPKSYLKQIIQYSFVNLIDCSNWGFCSVGDLRAAWRFVALEEPTLNRVVICDVDCQEVCSFIEKYYDVFLDNEKYGESLMLYYTPSWTHMIGGETFAPRIGANYLVKSGFVFRGLRETISGLLPTVAKTNRGKRIGYGQDERFLDEHVFPLLGSLRNVDLSLIDSEDCYSGTRTRRKTAHILRDLKNKRRRKH